MSRAPISLFRLGIGLRGVDARRCIVLGLCCPSMMRMMKNSWFFKLSASLYCGLCLIVFVIIHRKHLVRTLYFLGVRLSVFDDSIQPKVVYVAQGFGKTNVLYRVHVVY